MEKNVEIEKLPPGQNNTKKEIGEMARLKHIPIINRITLVSG